MALDGASSPTDPDRRSGVIIMYTTSRCGDCRATKAYLAAREVAYVEIDIEHDAAAAAVVMEVNDGRRSVPTLVCGDNAASLSRFTPSKAAAFLERCGLA
ncbi:MAG: glutaredoxin family protein [Trueperaceae bacterium]